MSIPYSIDLRKKVIQLIKQGKQKSEISKLLSINRSTIFRWYKRFEEVGNVDFKGYNNNQEKIKISQNILERIIKNNPSLTLFEIAKEVGNVSDVTVLNSLRRLGYSFKKSHGYIKKEMKKKDKNLCQK
jgi:transposase